MAQIAEVNLIALPQTFKVTENNRLISQSEVPDGHQTCKEIAEHTEGVFGALSVLKAIHLFEATKVQFIEKEKE